MDRVVLVGTARVTRLELRKTAGMEVRVRRALQVLVADRAQSEVRVGKEESEDRAWEERFTIRVPRPLQVTLSLRILHTDTMEATEEVPTGESTLAEPGAQEAPVVAGDMQVRVLRLDSVETADKAEQEGTEVAALTEWREPVGKTVPQAAPD